MGSTPAWGAECHHVLTERDIQSHIVHTRKTMVIAGEHELFDEKIFKTFHHEQLVRVFTPIVVQGNVVVGTIEAGFDTWKPEITEHERDALVALVSSYAPRFEKARLLHVLQTIVSNAVRLIRADSGSIHVLSHKREPQKDGQYAASLA